MPAQSFFEREDDDDDEEDGDDGWGEPLTGRDGIIYGCSIPNTLAITLDDGPHIYTPRLLGMLRGAGVRVTFFVNGNNYGSIYSAQNRRILQNALRDGHQIASHTWSHKDLATLSPGEVQREMGQLDEALRQIIHLAPVYMRPPYGSTSPSSLRVLRSLGYRIINWNIETKDTEHPADVGRSLAAYRVLDHPGAHQRGWIALQHDPVQSTAEELVERAIRYAQSRGFRLTTVAECLGDAGGEYRR